MLKITIIGNNLSYLEFEKALKPFRIFPVSEARKTFSRFDSRRLVEWQEKGYLKKVINKWYLFADIPLTEELGYRIGNCIHHPSYISLQSALSYYSLIPEAVYTQQAITTGKTIRYSTPVGSFSYYHIKPKFYFGYSILKFEGLPVLMAEPEKALLDYLYLSPQIKTTSDITTMRLNATVLRANFDWEKFLQYARVVNSTVLDKRINLVKKSIRNAYTE